MIDRGAARAARPRAAADASIESACAGLGADVEAGADPGRDQAQPVRRRADRRGAQGRDPGRAHADREGSRLHAASPRACCCTRSATRSLGEEALQADMHDALRRLLPALHQEGRASRPARRGAAAVRPGEARRGAEGRARPAVRLPRPADAVRPLLPAHRRAAASSCRRRSSCAWRWAWR